MDARAVFLGAGLLWAPAACGNSFDSGAATNSAANGSTASGMSASTTSSTSSSSSSGGAGGMAPKCAGAPDPALPCMAPKSCGVVATQMDVAMPLPAGVGGKIQDGVYALTGYNVYTGNGGPSGPMGFTVEEVMVISGKNVRWRQQVQQGAAHGFSGTLDTLNGFVRNATCEASTMYPPKPYTAMGNTLKVYDVSGKTEFVYTLVGP